VRGGLTPSHSPRSCTPFYKLRVATQRKERKKKSRRAVARTARGPGALARVIFPSAGRDRSLADKKGGEEEKATSPKVQLSTSPRSSYVIKLIKFAHHAAKKKRKRGKISAPNSKNNLPESCGQHISSRCHPSVPSVNTLQLQRKERKKKRDAQSVSARRSIASW